MYTNTNNSYTKNILSVDDSFVKLVEVINDNDSGKYQAKFEFSFNVSQVDAIKENAYSVLITLKKPNLSIEPSIVPTTRSGFDSSSSRSLIDNILTHKTKLLRLNNQESKNVIASKFADITSKINNHVLTAIKTGNSLENLGFVKTKLSVKQKNDLSNLDEIKNQEIYRLEQNISNERSIRLDLIKNQRTSPSKVSMLGNTSMTPATSLTGVIRKDNRNYYSQSLSTLSDSYTSKTPIEQNEYKVVIDQTVDDVVKVTTPITISDLMSLSSTTIVVTFELIKTIKSKNSKNQTSVLQKIEKTLNMLSFLGNLSPVDSPKVGLTFNNKDVSIHTKYQKNKAQLSLEESTIVVYKKRINEDLSEKYQLATTKIVKNEELNLRHRLTFSHLPGETSVYRVSMLGSSNFSDVVFKSPKSKTSTKLIIVPVLNQSSITVLAINNNLTDVAAARLLYRDTTAKEKNFSMVKSLVYFNDFSKVGSFSLTGLRPYHVYEFTTKLIFKNGMESISNYSSFLEYVPFSGNVNLTISNLNVTNDVQFLVNAESQDDQVKLISSMLSQVAGTYDLTNFLKRPADLDRFIAFNIIRYNLSNGDVDHLGVVANNTTFLDSQLSSKSSSKQLIQGNKYKYVIYPLVRKPDEVLVESVEAIDPETRKPYKFNPRKHRHPLSLIKGKSVTKEFLNNDHKDDMLYGSLGISSQVDVSISTGKTIIKSFNISYISKERLMLKWSIDGDETEIDHLVIFRESDGIKTVVGNAHCLDRNKSYVYELSNHDLGNIRFSLLPIYNDYSSGSEVSSNYILIDNQIKG